ncbi:DUF1152 domain-containing protein [Catellatospora sp. NPDC049609]|uniref:DUF1152 domain-containing protein n=1 Tax=Catellatospora sp. NPDC049609 TaxID=3155505 RepID=UPI0034431D20
MPSLRQPGLFEALSGCERVLIAGAGGGFDVYAGLPLALQLRADGVQVHLANLSFADLTALDLDVWLAPDLAAIGPDTKGLDDYFPERTLAQWLHLRGLPATVYAFPKTGVQPLRQAYRVLVERLRADAVVLVDGGTDILMRGDETGLGTPEEDMASLASVAGAGRAGAAGHLPGVRRRRPPRRQPRPGAGEPRRARPRRGVPGCPVDPRGLAAGP